MTEAFTEEAPSAPTPNVSGTGPTAPAGPTNRRRNQKAAPKLRRPVAPRPRREIQPGAVEEGWDILSSASAVLALLCCWMLLQLLVLGGIVENRNQDLLYAKYRSELAQATAPTGALDFNNVPIQRGAPVATISIPRIHLNQVVVQGSTSRDLMAGPGHYPSTPLPGQQGVSVVMGRAATYGGPFGRIDELKQGDSIVVQNAEGKVTLHVLGVRRAGDPVPPAPTGTQAQLTLVTATSSGFLSAIRPRNVLYVDAAADKGTGDGYVAISTPADAPMAHDPSVLPRITLFLACLIALVLAVSALRRRIRASLVWLCAAPVAIALAWVTTDAVAALLPNLM